MAKRPDLTPCIICEKAVIYLWQDDTPATNLNSACDVDISAHYGSEFDNSNYHGIICDECLSKLIQSKRLTFIGHHIQQ